MSQELHYTSAPRGLWPGSQGYCTVACTAHMPRSLAERLEGLSAYRNIFPPHDPRAAQNPVVFSHLRVMIAGASRHVLSRVGFAGLDYTERTNKYAHHVVLDPTELPRGGPAWLLSQPGFLRAAWDGNVGWIDTPHPVPHGDVRPNICRAWQQATSDAGWAGILAETFLAGSKPVAYLIHETGQDILSLLLEAQSLLPPDRRWELTFSTYFTTLPQGVVCAWRGVVRGTPEETQARRAGQALVLDVSRSLGPAHGGPLVEQARTGRPAVARFAREATPPSLPAGQLPGANQPIVLESVHAATTYSMVPELPNPPALSRPLRSRQSSGTPWPRRARAIVSAICLLLLIAGGTGVSLMLKSRKARTSHRLAQASIEPNAGRADRQNQIPPMKSPSGPAAPSVAPAQIGTQRHGLSAVAGPPVTADLANDRQHGKTDTARRDGRQDRTPVSSIEKPNSPAPKSNLAPKTDAVVASPSTESLTQTENGNRTSEYRWVELPQVNSLNENEPVDFEILPNEPLPNHEGSGAVSLELNGHKDPVYAHLSIGSVRMNMTEGSGLLIRSDAPGSEHKLAKFTINGRRLSFTWEKNLLPKYKEHMDALRSCILIVDNGDKTPLRCVILRKRGGRDSPISGSHLGTSLTDDIDWGPSGRPFRRELRLGRCNWSEGRPPITDRAHDPKGQFRAYSVGQLAEPSIILKLVQSLESPSIPVHLVLAFEPSEPFQRDRAIKDLRHMNDDLPNRKLTGTDAADEGRLQAQFARLTAARRDQIGIIEKEIKKPTFRNANLSVYLQKFSMINNQLKQNTGDFQWIKNQDNFGRRFGESVDILDRIHAVKAAMTGNYAAVSVSIEMLVENRYVEIARFGEFDQKAEKKNGSSANGGKP